MLSTVSCVKGSSHKLQLSPKPCIRVQIELDMGVDDASIKELKASLAKWMATRKSELKEGSLWVVLSGSSLPFKSVLSIECILNFKCALRLHNRALCYCNVQGRGCPIF